VRICLRMGHLVMKLFMRETPLERFEGRRV
jgi:hypothetical protein